MKNSLLSIILGLLYNVTSAQLMITPGAHWVNNGAAFVVLKDMDIINDGTIDAGGSVVKFTGTASNLIGGSGATVFHEVELAKAGSNKVTLLNSIDVSKRVIFTSGLLDLNQHVLTLAEIAYLYNESENSRITGLNGGEVVIRMPLDAPAGINPGNLGAVITSASNLGIVMIRRGHKSQSGIGLANSIDRYFDITPANNGALDATLRSYYFDAELNTQVENVMEMFKSIDGGAGWTLQSVNSRNATENYVEKNGVNSFSRWTLSSSGAPLPVTGLEFYAKRINGNKVELKWSTKQEFNSKGFGIERKKENENSFTPNGFVNSLAPGGNSNIPLHYTQIDENSYTGITYYYLKQVDFDGKFRYSVIQFVNGKNAIEASLKVWPIPSAGDVNVLLQGIEKDELQVFDITGRMIQHTPVNNNTQLSINGLVKGIYIIRLAQHSDMSQKIVVQ
ncbi:MAG: T9SS type A sorting domain-containing protein [Ferruginibacter sp.]